MSEFGAWAKDNTVKDDDKPRGFRPRTSKGLGKVDPYLKGSNTCPKCFMPKAIVTGACFCY